MNQAEDVEVILGHKRRYKFHSGTLARNSTLFAGMLTEPNAAKLNKKAREAGVKIRWMIELTRLPCDQYPAGCLELVELTPTGERADGCNGLIVNENGRVPQAERDFGHYESVLYAFYNQDLVIDDSDVGAALQDCDDLLEIADYLGCTSLICKPIEVALFKLGQALFRFIQKAPHLYLEFACRIRSELVFRECMIHLVGDWGRLRKKSNVMARLRLLPGIRGLIEKYHRMLVKKGERLEVAITSVYPGNMAAPSDELPIKREAYSRDIFIWMSLTFFRHWLSQRIIQDKGRHGPDGGYELYRQLGTGGDAYMDRSMMMQFHAKFPMTKKALNVIENHVSEIKVVMSEMVQQHGLLKSRCQLDLQRFPVGYLTCTEFERADLPWLKDLAPATVSKKREYQPGGNDIARANLETAKKLKARSMSVEESIDEEGIDEEGEEDD